MLRVVEELTASTNRRIAVVPQRRVVPASNGLKPLEDLSPAPVHRLHFVVNGRVDEEHPRAVAASLHHDLLQIAHRVLLDCEGDAGRIRLPESFEVFGPFGSPWLEPVETRFLWHLSEQRPNADGPTEPHVLD